MQRGSYKTAERYFHGEPSVASVFQIEKRSMRIGGRVPVRTIFPKLFVLRSVRRRATLYAETEYRQANEQYGYTSYALGR